MDLLEIGTALREGRERKGFSLDDVEQRIKIAQPVLAALESGDQTRFPHPVYAKGFVRSYASLLGLDAVELCADFSREYPVPADSDHTEEHAPQITVKVRTSSHVPWLRIAILSVIFAGMCAAAWYAYDVLWRQDFLVSVTGLLGDATSNSTGMPAATVQHRTEPVAPLTQMSEVRAVDGAERPTQEAEHDAGQPRDAFLSAADTVTLGNATEVAVSARSVNASLPAPPVEEVKNASSSGALGAPSPVARSNSGSGKERTLVITAHAATWLQARPDGKVVDYFLRKGESATVSFTQSLNIKFGNAGGVLMTLDGRPYPFDAKSGEVKTLVIQ